MKGETYVKSVLLSSGKTTHITVRKRLKAFEVKTRTKYAEYNFYTKAKNGKEALNNLITQSSDFKRLLNKTESNNMTITISHIKTRKR